MADLIGEFHSHGTSQLYSPWDDLQLINMINDASTQSWKNEVWNVKHNCNTRTYTHTPKRDGSLEQAGNTTLELFKITKKNNYRGGTESQSFRNGWSTHIYTSSWNYLKWSAKAKEKKLCFLSKRIHQKALDISEDQQNLVKEKNSQKQTIDDPMQKAAQGWTWPDETTWLINHTIESSLVYNHFKCKQKQGTHKTKSI